MTTFILESLLGASLWALGLNVQSRSIFDEECENDSKLSSMSKSKIKEFQKEVLEIQFGSLVLQQGPLSLQLTLYGHLQPLGARVRRHGTRYRNGWK